MNVIFDEMAAVFRYAGSKMRMPLAVSSVSIPSSVLGTGALRALKAVAGMALWVMGMTMVLPVRLSVTVMELSPLGGLWLVLATRCGGEVWGGGLHLGGYDGHGEGCLCRDGCAKACQREC